MKLVGATNWFVRGPFMIEGLLCGLGGAVAAVILLVLGRSIFLGHVVHLGHTDVHAWPFGVHVLIVLGAGCCSAPPAPASRSAVSSRSDPNRPSVALEVVRRRTGKLVVRRAVLRRPGVADSCSTDKRGSGEASPGDLAVVRKGRGRARLERVLGPGERDRDRARGAARPGGRARGVRAVRAARAVDRGPRRPARRARVHDRPRDGEGLRRRARRCTTTACSSTSRTSPGSSRPGSPLDRGAAERAFSVYVPGLVAPMLPPELSDDACSLRPDVDRLCVTVEVELASGEARFYRSVIRSKARLTYAQARGDPGRPGAGRAGADRGAAPSRARDLGAARASASPAARCGSRAAEVAFAFDGEGGVADAPGASRSRTRTCSSRS